MSKYMNVLGTSLGRWYVLNGIFPQNIYYLQREGDFTGEQDIPSYWNVLSNGTC
jgi:hypothetical protein